VQRERRVFLRALASVPLSLPLFRGHARSQSPPAFQLGWNHPWIAYGHDFGPAWGHDGISTSGWTHETFVGARGFTAARVVRDRATGRGSLRVTADLLGQDSTRSSGEVHLSLLDHWPFTCPSRATPVSVAADGALVRYRVRLPRGSAGPPSAPNGLQLVFKTRLGDAQWPSMYTRWENVNPAWEGRDVDITARISSAGAAHVDAGFDPARVSLIGLKLGMNAGSASALRDFIHIDDVAIETDPVLAFDFEEPQLERDIRRIREHAGEAFSVVRIFVFCDGRASPMFSPDGKVAGLDDRFFSDFDALVDIAERNRILLIPVLLDFHWCARATAVSGVQLGGHANVIRDAAVRDTFLEGALKPLLQRYADRDAILAWDLVNEPEWAIRGIPGASEDTSDLVRFSEMRQFVAACTRHVNRFAPRQLVTVGSARRRWTALWTGLGLDLYQFHWYDRFEREEPFPWPPYHELGLDKPCIIGEVPTAGTQYSAAQFISAAANAGYSGLLLWSYRGRDGASSLCSTPGFESRSRP
jgi:hypothetical protein